MGKPLLRLQFYSSISISSRVWQPNDTIACFPYPKCVNHFSFCTAHKKYQLEGNALIQPQYCIAGNFRKENFCRLLTFAVPNYATPPNCTEKTFAYSHKTARFAKVFSLKSFPLYCIDREEHPERNWKTLFNTKQYKYIQTTNVQEAQLSITKKKTPYTQTKLHN